MSDDEIPKVIMMVNSVLPTWVMILAWIVPFTLATIGFTRTSNWRLLLVSIVCVPFIIYFIWAASGIWSDHLVALAFNRSAQIVSIVVIILLISTFRE